MADRSGTFEFKITLPNEVSQQDTQPATTNIARKSSFWSNAHPRGKLGENIARYNFKSIAKIGLAIRASRMGNELVGSYTNNRLQQRRFNAGMQKAMWGIGIAKFGAFGALYAGVDIGYRSLIHDFEVGKKNREAENIRVRAGNIQYNGNRFGGRKL